MNSSVNNNPFRYRGYYYYDADFGLYYLQTRYYDSNTGRFINADGYVSTGQGIVGNNMFAYCNNNPVMFVDPTGEKFEFFKNIGGFFDNIAETGKTIFGKKYKAQNYPELKDYYSQSDAKKAIEEQFEDLKVDFNNEDKCVIIYNSNAITSRADRMYISTILSRTEKIERTARDISAEWIGHNVWDVWLPGENVQNYNVDYEKDNRDWVSGITKILRILGFY